MDNNGTKIYGLIGYPLGHSFSKEFFNTKFAAENIDATYKNFEIRSIDQLSQVIEGNPNLQGFNVTIPYKEQVIPYLDALDNTAQEIGAVNVVKLVRTTDGTKLIGYNSDTIGFMNSIKPLLNHTHTRALVLGTGGASKAVVYALKQLGLTPTLVSRTEAEGQYTYQELRQHPEIVAEHTVIVNTTPLGMYPHVDTCPDIPYDHVGERHVCYDVVYNPDTTMFMRKCAEKGATTKNGIEMLHLQAVAAWEIWCR